MCARAMSSNIRNAVLGSLAVSSLCVIAGGIQPPAKFGLVNDLDAGHTRYSPLAEITPRNVNGLRPVWVYGTGVEGRGWQVSPIVVAGVMYLSVPGGAAAIDIDTGLRLWKFTPSALSRPGRDRGVAYWPGKGTLGPRVIYTVADRMYALDAKTGQPVETFGNKGMLNLRDDVADKYPNAQYAINSPAGIYKELAIVAPSTQEFGSKGPSGDPRAFDILTGKLVWRFHTVPQPGEPNADSWGPNGWIDRAGPSAWAGVTVDATNGLVFIPVGNPIPDFVPAERPGDNLFTNSVLVLDARTGQLKWWYQLAPSDGLDHDLAAAPVLYRNRETKQLLAAGGKDGYVHIIDRTTHKLIAKTAVTTVDVNPPSPTPQGVKICPGPAGGVEWNGPAFDPERHSLFVGALDFCAIFRSEPGTQPQAGGSNMGGTWTGVGAATGWVTALDADTGKKLWQFHADSAVLGAVTPTAGGIVFSGDNAGNFRVFDSTSGKILKTVDTGGSLSGGMITYEAKGKQYVSFTSGNVSRTLFGAVGRPSVVVMALPDAVIAAEVSLNKPDIARGHDLYNGVCGVCHGADGKTWHGVDLTRVKDKMDAEQLMAFIKKPRSPMPKPFPEPLDAQSLRDIRDIANFIMQWK